MSFNYRIIFKIVNIITIIIGIAMLFPLVTAIAFNEANEALTFLSLSIILILSASTCLHFYKYTHGRIRMRDGYLIVALCWLTASVWGALPYLISGLTSSFIDALFESVSAFSTTGSTLFNLDVIPRSLLMWKVICSWLGGMGMLVLAISILPALGIDGKNLIEAEIPNPVLSNMSNRISDSAKNLYIFYVIFSVVEFFLLFLGPMNAFDAIINTLSSVSTGGMPGMRYALDRQDSFYVEAVLSTFTILTSVNFTLYYHLYRRHWRTVFTNIELRAFGILLLGSSTLIVINLYLTQTYSFFKALRYGIFQAISMATTSGFSIIGYAGWPAFSMTILTILMLIGGCSFSTCGAIKIARVLVMLKLIFRGIYKRIHPRSVVAVKLGSKPVSSQRVSHITVFIMLYLIIIMAGALLLSLQNLDLVTTLSSSLAMISNVGIGFGEVASGDFSIYCRPLRLVLCLLMIIGRLELFTVITLFMPSFWNPNKYREN